MNDKNITDKINQNMYINIDPDEYVDEIVREKNYVSYNRRRATPEERAKNRRERLGKRRLELLKELKEINNELS